MAPRTGVIFDIDGTLVDPTYLHTAAWRRAFLDHGLDILTADIHRHIGMGSGLLLERLAGTTRDDLKDAWRKHFEALKPEIRALPGAPDLLRAVAESGAAVVLASSSEEDDVEDLLDALDVGDIVDVVTSSGDVEEAKPDPEVFEVAMAKAGLEAGRAIVVGDTVWDVEAAARCGLPCVGVLTGGISDGELRQAGAVAVYRGARDLLDDLRAGPLGPFLGATTP